MNANNDIPHREQRVFAPGRAHRYKPEFRLSFQGSFLLSSRPASCWQEGLSSENFIAGGNTLIILNIYMAQSTHSYQPNG